MMKECVNVERIALAGFICRSISLYEVFGLMGGFSLRRGFLRCVGSLGIKSRSRSYSDGVEDL